MLFADGAFGLVLLGLWLFCIIDVITSDESQIRNLPKIAWLLIVVVLFDIGSLAWLIAGRDWNRGTARVARPAGAHPEYDRPGRHVAQNPDDDEQFLAQVKARAEAQRRQYQEQRRRDLQDEQDRLTRRRPDDEPV